MDSMSSQILPGGTSASPMMGSQPQGSGNVAGLVRPPPVMPGLPFPPGTMIPPQGMPAPPMGMPPPMIGGMMPPPIPPGAPRPPLLVGAWQPPVPPVTLNPPPVVNTTVPIATPDLHPTDRFVSTVFVGSISDRAPDALVRQLLMKCGKMNSWKRVQGTAGKLQAFGFCEYADPESTLRALRLLHNFKLGSKSLSVKVDSKSRKDLQKYILRKRKKKEGLSQEEALKVAEEEVEGGNMGESLEEELNEATKESDKQTKELLETLIKENSSAFEGDEDTDLKNNVTEAMISMARQTGKIGPDESMEDIDERVRDRVSDEIKKFRENYKKSEEKRMKKIGKDKVSDKVDEDDLKEDKHTKDDSGREDRITKEEKSEKVAKVEERLSSSRSSKEDRSSREERGRRENRTSRDRDREDRRVRSRRSRSGSTHRTRSRSRERRRTKSRSRSRDRDEELETIRMEKKRRERQLAFEERLRKWESRERRKQRDYQRLEDKDSQKYSMDKEKKKSDHYFAGYEDEKDDYRHYRGSTMDEKLQEREREVEEDERDRLKEKQDLEQSGQVPGIEVMDTQPAIEAKEVERENVDSGPDVVAKQQKPIPPLEEEPPPPQITAAFHSEYHLSHLQLEEEVKPKVAFVFGSKPQLTSANSEPTQGANATKQKKGLGVFNTDEDDHEEGPKRKPITLPPVEEDKQVESKKYTSEERKKLMKSLVDSIPTSKGDLFSYQIKWEYLDQVLVDKRISPWINKKIVEYIGEEEPALTEFIINSLKQECTPKALLDEISMILDDEGEVFVVKLWRLLIYETEAKVLGISKVV